MIQLKRLLIAGMLLAGITQGRGAGSLVLTVTDAEGRVGRSWTPVSVPVDFSGASDAERRADQFRLTAVGVTNSEGVADAIAQFEPDAPGSTGGMLRWLMSPGPAGQRRFIVKAETSSIPPLMHVGRDEATGQLELSEAGKPVLRYNYQTNDPGDVLARVRPDDRKYARARSDYIHPLYGLDGQELTKDWPMEHPHHRGIYWAWPEVDYRGERGDLHALQRVFSRPTGNCTFKDGSVCAVINAENLWRWEDQEPIVRESTLIRAWRAGPTGRFIDLAFQFTALRDDVALARRGMAAYGGLNIRLAPVQDQEIVFHTDPAGTQSRGAWAQLSGVFPGGKKAGLAVFQAPTNRDYPGDWIKYPEINWLQPTFPASGTRYVLKMGQPLVLRFRLWICPDKAGETKLADGWTGYASLPLATISRQ
jgi:hypothetical protein